MSDIKEAFMNGKRFFMCDPRKNVECMGRFQEHCGKQCFCTTNPLYSSKPNHALTYEEYYKEEGIRIQLFGYTPREVIE